MGKLSPKFSRSCLPVSDSSRSLHRIMAKEQQRKIKTQQVVKLTGVVHECDEEFVALYTTIPVRPVAPCLELFRVGDGLLNWRHIIAVLPENAPYTLVNAAPEFAAALAILETIKEGYVNTWMETDIVKRWSAKAYSEPPFAHFELDVMNRTIDLIENDLEAAKLSTPAVLGQLEKTRQKMANLPTEDISWWPVVLASNFKVGKYWENWELLRRWNEWTQDCPTMEKLHNRFHEAIVQDGDRLRELSIACKPNEEQSPLEITLNRDAFRRRLGYLGLPNSDAALNPGSSQTRK